MTSAEILKAARKVVSKPAQWTKKELARDVDGLQVEPRSPRATCWCPRGAVYKVLDGDTARFVWIVSLLGRQTWQGSILRANDNRRTKHADVLRWFDRAIADEELREKVIENA